MGKRADGPTGYTARLRLMRDGVADAGTKTFERKQAVDSWLKRESALAEPGYVLDARTMDNARVVLRRLGLRRKPGIYGCFR